ncbi:MAG: hypothetical protein A49_16360 [Methyloceanibacter sp.]|nr:MAG: hypothetical protein A49_16360 [Methyloceanibacter sp.]
MLQTRGQAASGDAVSVERQDGDRTEGRIPLIPFIQLVRHSFEKGGSFGRFYPP